MDCRFKIFYLIANPNERQAQIVKGIDFFKIISLHESATQSNTQVDSQPAPNQANQARTLSFLSEITPRCKSKPAAVNTRDWQISKSWNVGQTSFGYCSYAGLINT